MTCAFLRLIHTPCLLVWAQGNEFGPYSKGAFLRLFETKFRYEPFDTDIAPYVVDGAVQMARVEDS